MSLKHASYRAKVSVSELASSHNNCDYYNLIDDSNFIEKDFYDADHLSEIGAKKLSKLISSKIEKES